MKQYHSFLVHRYCKHGCPLFSLKRLKLLLLWRKQMVLWFFVIRVKKKGKKKEESVIPLVFLALLFKTSSTKMTVPFFTNKKRSIIFLENRRRIDTHYCYRLDPMLFLMICDFHGSHNSICFPIKILHKDCFQFLLGPIIVPWENEKKTYAKFCGINKLHFGVRESRRCAIVFSSHASNTVIPWN